MRARIIAFYLPQYYPFKENDEWWGKGFTEWTNVGKAKSLFKGHYQPRVPSDLGYYDLRLPEVREAQAELAKEAGIEGFCYWHYWFDHKRQLMGRVFDEVLTSGTPALPFCLGWANHSWYAKTWDKDVKDKLLCEQKYLGKTDYDAHFEYVLKAFKDARYITVDGCPLFYIFDPLKLPIDFIPYWNKLAKQNGLKKIFFVGRLINERDMQQLLENGFDAVVPERMGEIYSHLPLWKRIIYRGLKLFSKKPKFCFEYEAAAKFFIKESDKNEKVIPQIIPQWDHSPRSGTRGTILHNSTPSKFFKHAKCALEIVENKKNNLIFLKSWNEWAEGTYMEPDLRYGKGYIEALAKALGDNHSKS